MLFYHHITYFTSRENPLTSNSTNNAIQDRRQLLHSMRMRIEIHVAAKGDRNKEILMVNKGQMYYELKKKKPVL